MQFLTYQECWNWLSERIPTVGTHSSAQYYPKLPFQDYGEREHPLPSDSGRKVALGKTALKCVTNDRQGVLVWLQNCNVWPSSAHMPILYRYRQALGETRSVEEMPGLLVSPGELDDATSLIVLSLEFYWDCLTISDSGDAAFYVSHDEYFSFLSQDRSIYDRFEEAAKIFIDDNHTIQP